MAYSVINGELINTSKRRGGCGRHWSDDEVIITSHEPWKKSAAYKSKRARKQK